MKKFQPNSNSYAYLGQRFKAWILDALILLVCLVPLSYAGYEVAKNTPYFTDKRAAYEQCVDELNHYAIEAKLSKEKEKDVFYSTDELLTEYFVSQMLLSYDNDPSAFTDAGIDENPHDNEKIKDKYVSATLNEDTLAYFYVVYACTNEKAINDPYKLNYQGKIPMVFYKDLLKAKTSDSSVYNYGEDESYPYLKSNFAINLYKYYCQGISEGDAGSSYDQIKSVYTSVMTESCTKMVNFKFYSDTKNEYNIIGNQLAQIVNINYLICYAILFVLFFVLIPLILGNQRTLFKFAFKLSIFSERDTPITPLQFVGRALCDLVINSIIILPASMVASGSAMASRELFHIGGWSCSLTLFVIILGILSIINLIYWGFKKNGQTLQDRLTKTMSEDTRELDIVGEDEITLGE